MRIHNQENTRLGEPRDLAGPASDVGLHEPADPREGPRLAAKAVLHVLRTRRHTLTLPPAAATDHELADGSR